MKLKQVFAVLLALEVMISSSPAIDYPSVTQPGKATAETRNDDIILENNVLRLVLSHRCGKLRPAGFFDTMTTAELEDVRSEFFYITVGLEKKTYPCSQFTLQERYKVLKIAPRPRSRGSSSPEPTTTSRASGTRPRTTGRERTAISAPL